MKKTNVVLFGIIGASIFLTIFIFVYSNFRGGDIQRDILKITYQFLLMVVAGGALSWLYKRLDFRREANSMERKEFLELYSSLIQTYNEYKEVKRLLRAKSLRTIRTKEGVEKRVLLYEPYDKLLNDLNKTQLKFELFKKLAKGRNHFFEKVDQLYDADSPNSLYGDLKVVEEYINGVVEEYESASRVYEKSPEYVLLENLNSTFEFIVLKEKASPNKKNATTSFHSAIDKISIVMNGLKDTS